MCGFVGFANLKRNLSSAEQNADIKNMTKNLSHRGPDEENFFIKDHICIGHRRLIILDAENGKIGENIFVNAEDFDRFIINDKFNITAVFQRQSSVGQSVAYQSQLSNRISPQSVAFLYPNLPRECRNYQRASGKYATKKRRCDGSDAPHQASNGADERGFVARRN